MRCLAATLALAGVALAGCGRSPAATDPGSEELVLRGYPAPGHAESLAELIGRLLSVGDRRVGEVRVGPGDQLLLLAPRSVHENVAELVRAASEASATRRPASVAMTYWLVAARPVPEPIAPPANLSEIGAVLDQITQAQGPHEFGLIERMQLRQIPDGQAARATSPALQLGQRVSISDDDIVAIINAEPPGQDMIRTTVRLRPSQLLVLAQVGLDFGLSPFPGERPSRTAGRAAFEKALYLVIRADVDPPA